MSALRATFELQVKKDSRWVAQGTFDSEPEAKAVADRQFAGRACEGVRIMRNWLRADGLIIETEIHCQTKTVKEDETVRLAQVNEPPPVCETDTDFHGYGSRQFINRLFRAYLDKVVLTPLEIVHDFKEFKRLQNEGMLLSGAVERAAQLQAGEGGADAKARAEEIHNLVDTLIGRARKYETVKVPKIAAKLGDAMAELGAAANEPLAAVMLTRDLAGHRTWLAKLARLADLVRGEDNAEAVALLDLALSDVLTSNVLGDLLGAQDGLASAIITMFDLADGRMDTGPSEAGASTGMLNTLMAEGKLPLCRICLMDRAHRQLKSAQPLFRADPAREVVEFNRIVERVLVPGGFISGPETAEALTLRSMRVTAQGGVAGRRAAILATLRAMPDMASGVVYLTELLKSSFGQENADDIGLKLNEAMSKPTLQEFTERKLTPSERMARGSQAYRLLEAAECSDTIKSRVLNHIDTLIDNFLVSEQIIEKLDANDSHLRHRATRLVRFCAAGMVPPKGKARTRTQTRILTMLRQPSFDQHFIEGIPDAENAQKSLRDFHQLLVKAGFG